MAAIPIPDLQPGPFNPSPALIAAYAASQIHHQAVNHIYSFIVPGDWVATAENATAHAREQGTLKDAEVEQLMELHRKLAALEPTQDGSPPPQWSDFVGLVNQTANRIFSDANVSPLAAAAASIMRENTINPPPGSPGHRDYKWWHVDIIVTILTLDPLIGAAGSAASAF